MTEAVSSAYSTKQNISFLISSLKDLCSAAIAFLKSLIEMVRSVLLKNTVVFIVLLFLCSTTTNNGSPDSMANQLPECKVEVNEWKTNCFKPPTEWIAMFDDNEGDAMKGCKDACVVKNVTELIKKNVIPILTLGNCYVKCPCLDLSFCNGLEAFTNVACPSDLAVEEPGTCSTKNNKEPARATSPSIPKSSRAMAMTEESTSFPYVQSSASKALSSGAVGSDTNVFSYQSTVLSTSATVSQDASRKLESNVDTTVSIPHSSKGLEQTLLSSVIEHTDITTRYPATEEKKKEGSPATGTTLYPVETSTTLSPQASTKLSSSLSSTVPDFFKASRSINTFTTSRLLTATSASTSLFTVLNSEDESTSPSTTSQPISMSTPAVSTLSKMDSTTLRLFSSTSSNERIEEASSSTSGFKEITSATTPSKISSNEYTASTLEGFQTDWKSSVQTSAVLKSSDKVVQSSTTEATTEEKGSLNTTSIPKSTTEVEEENQSETLPFYQNFTTFEPMPEISSGTMTTADHEETPFVTTSLRPHHDAQSTEQKTTETSPHPHHDAQTTETSSSGKTSVPEPLDATTTWHPKRLTPVPAFGHSTSIAITEEYAKTSPAAKVTLLATRPSQPSTTTLPTITDQSATVETTTEEDSDLSSLEQNAQSSTTGSQNYANATTSERNVTSVASEDTTSEQPSSSSSSGPSPCPPQYHEGPSYCYRFTPPSANTYRKAAKFCTLDMNSDLIDEADLRNNEVLPFMKNLSETQSPQIDLLFINENGSKFLKKTHSVRIVSLLRSNIALLKVNATAGIDTVSPNTIGICRCPKFGGQLSCDLETVSFYRPGGDFLLPANRTLQIGEVANISCTGTESKVQVTCDNYGRLTPHPTMIECETDDGEKETAWNRKIRSSCTECWRLGTEKCVRVEGGVQCKCREHWTGFTCWKSPNMCALTGLTCEHGKCQSQVDRAVCLCDEEFAGARCTVNKSELAFYSDTKSSFVSAPTLSAAALFLTEMALIVAHIFLKDGTLKGQDPQVFFQNARSCVLATAGLSIVLFRHPALLGLRAYSCGFWFIVTTSLLSCGIGLLALEARNAFRATKLLGTNTWRSILTGYTQKPTELGFQVGCVVFSSMAVVLFVFRTMYDQVTSTWSCLGRFTVTSTNLWFPLVQLNTVAALAATSYSYKGLFIRRNLPQYQEMLDEFARSVPGDVRNTIEKCHRDLHFTMAGPWLLLGYWQFLAVASDWVTDPVSNTLTVAFALLYCAKNLLQFIVTTPSLYSKAIWKAIRLLPSSLAPASDPVTRWSREEILAKFEKGARARLRRTRFRFRHLRPAHRGYLPRVVRRELEERWSDAYRKLREKHPNKTKASIIEMIYRHDVVRMRTLERSMAKRGSIKKVFRRWSTYAYCKDPKPDVDPRRRPETEHERMMREREEIVQGLYLFNGPPPIIRGSMLERNRVEVKDRPSQSVPIAIVTAIDDYGNTYQQAVLKAPVAVVRDELLPSTSRAGDVDRLERGEHRAANNSAQGDDELDRETLEYIEQMIESTFEMAVQNQDYLERLLALRSW